MKKRIVILERHFTYREKGGWFSQKENIKILYDLTDIKLNARLDELNKAYHKNFYQITADFNLTTKKRRNYFVNYLLDNSRRFKTSWEFQELKDIASNIIYSL